MPYRTQRCRPAVIVTIDGGYPGLLTIVGKAGSLSNDCSIGGNGKAQVSPRVARGEVRSAG